MKIFGDNVLSLYICTQTIKGFYVYLLSSFYIGVRSFVKSTGSFLCSYFPKNVYLWKNTLNFNKYISICESIK